MSATVGGGSRSRDHPVVSAKLLMMRLHINRWSPLHPTQWTSTHFLWTTVSVDMWVVLYGGMHCQDSSLRYNEPRYSAAFDSRRSCHALEFKSSQSQLLKLSWQLWRSSCRFKSDKMAISGVREVRQFGAKGDGTGDDTEAVKKAISSLPHYGGVLYFPPGRSSPSPRPLHPFPRAPSQQRATILAKITVPSAQVTPLPYVEMLPHSCLQHPDKPNVDGAVGCDSHRFTALHTGLYLLSECLRLGDRPVVIRGDGVGVTRLIWTVGAASSGDQCLRTEYGSVLQPLPCHQPAAFQPQ